MTDNKATQQMKMFKKGIPQMPEGYYSSGPNPNLEKFVEEHATPYDPATDDYNVPPFDKPIKTTKSSTIYNMHSYWSKKPYDAIQQYIRHYTKPGELILDPFCGSGSTALAALLENRKVIAIDLSPAATFITKNYCTPVDVDKLHKAYSKLVKAVKPEIDWLYETRCDRCDGRAIIAYTVYSQVYQCPRCLEKVALFDCPEVTITIKTGKSKKIRVCRYCKEKGHKEEISTRSTTFGSIPVATSYFCEDGCSPKRDERKHNDPNPKKRSYFENFDMKKILEIENRKIPYWQPDIDMIRGQETTRNAHIAGGDWYTVSDLFTKRNLWALSRILKEADDGDDIRFYVQSSLLSCSKKAQHLDEGGGYIPGNYYLPPMFKERNVLGVLDRITQKTIKAKGLISSLIENPDFIISTQSATNIREISDNSIDHIFTDPPYSGKVQYGELSFIWEAWMNFDTEWVNDEIIVNDYRNKTEEDWYQLMKRAFQECFRVLKPGRWLALCYHDTSEGTWDLVQDLMAEVGFISEQNEKVLYIDTGGKTYVQYTSEKVTKRDLVINFRKPRPGEIHAAIAITGDEDERTFSQKARAILTEALERSPGSTADRLYDELVSRMVRKGEFERHNFDTLLRGVAEEVQMPNGEGKFISRWYLLETAGEVDAAESQKESAAAERLEAFMVDHLSDHPEFDGVHYSDLFEQYLPVRDKPRRLLADWLPEFFYRTPEGTWRPPKDAEERQQKNALRTSGALRRVRRFTNAIFNSVPPAEKDRPENPATLAVWINECRRAGLYDLGKLLYEQGGHSFEGLTEKEQLEVQENYLICTRRSGVDSTDKTQTSRQDRLF